VVGRKTYLGGSTVLRFSPRSRNAWLESGPNSAEGEANVKRAADKKGALGKIKDMDERDAERLAKRRAERSRRPPPSN
jgi:hypothetical protein